MDRLEIMRNELITTPVEKWAHITYLGGDSWIKPIWSSVNKAVSENRIKKLPKKSSELGMSVSIKFDMLPRIISRINQGANELFKHYQDNGEESHESSESKEGVGFKMDDNHKFELLADIDALLFELNSCCELIKQIFSMIYNHTGRNLDVKDAGKELKDILRNRGEDTSWFKELDIQRNFLIHSGAPYIAINLSNVPKHYDLLIMKENLKEFSDKKKFFKFTELAAIVDGFTKSRLALRTHLIEYIDNLNLVSDEPQSSLLTDCVKTLLMMFYFMILLPYVSYYLVSLLTNKPGLLGSGILFLIFWGDFCFYHGEVCSH